MLSIPGKIRKLLWYGVTVPCLLILHTTTFSQDLLSLLVGGGDRYMMTGGNPFLSQVEAFSFQMDGSESYRPLIQYDFRFDNIYHEVRSDGIENEFQHASRGLELILPISGSQLRPLMRISLRSSRFISTFNQSSDEQSELQNKYTDAAVNLSMHIGKYIHVAGGFGKSTEGQRSLGNYETSLSIRPTDRGLIMLKLGSWGSWQSLALNVAGVSGVLPLDFRRQGTEITFIVPVGSVIVYGKGNHFVLSSIDDGGREHQTRSVPTGIVNAFEIGSHFNVSEHWRGLVKIEHDRINATAEFTSRNSRYGAIKDLSYDDLSVLSAAQYESANGAIFIADFQWRSLGAGILGHAESWPFVSIFKSLISGREYFKGDGSLRYWRLHGGGKVPVSKSLQFGIGLNYFQITPTLKVDSWEPEFLIYGVRDYEERSLLVTRLSLLLLSGGVEARLGSLLMKYTASQFVPISIQKVDEGSEGMQNPISGSSISTSASGGQTHSFTIAYEF